MPVVVPVAVPVVVAAAFVAAPAEGSGVAALGPLAAVLGVAPELVCPAPAAATAVETGAGELKTAC